MCLSVRDARDAFDRARELCNIRLIPSPRDARCALPSLRCTLPLQRIAPRVYTCTRCRFVVGASCAVSVVFLAYVRAGCGIFKDRLRGAVVLNILKFMICQESGVRWDPVLRGGFTF